jgi:hypothetical protein
MSERHKDAEVKREKERRARFSALRAAIEEGDASGIADDSVFARIREKPKRHHSTTLTRGRPCLASHQRLATSPQSPAPR